MKGQKGTDLQSFVDHVLRELYRIPQHQRTTLTLLETIHHRQQQFGKDRFFTSGCDYITFAQVIDHLLQQISDQEDDHAWYCPSWKGYDPDKKRSFLLEHTLIDSSDRYIRFKKFFVECSTYQVEDYVQKAILCSKHMFSQKPTTVEYVNLITGKHHAVRVA